MAGSSCGGLLWRAWSRSWWLLHVYITSNSSGFFSFFGWSERFHTRVTGVPRHWTTLGSAGPAPSCQVVEQAPPRSARTRRGAWARNWNWQAKWAQPQHAAVLCASMTTCCLVHSVLEPACQVAAGRVRFCHPLRVHVCAKRGSPTRASHRLFWSSMCNCLPRNSSVTTPKACSLELALSASSSTPQPSAARLRLLR